MPDGAYNADHQTFSKATVLLILLLFLYVAWVARTFELMMTFSSS